MPSAVLEVVVGLVFVFFLFSMLCSGINEMISRTTGKRADFLAIGVWRLLEHSGAEGERDKYFREFWEHPLVRQLGPPAPEVGEEPDAPEKRRARRAVRRGWRALCRSMRGRLSAKPMRTAMAAMPSDPRRVEERRPRPSYIPAQTFATVVGSFVREDRAALMGRSEDGGDSPAAPAESPLTRALRALAAEAGDDPQRLRVSLERWYDAQMERVSGWYKRESKRMLLYLGALVVLALNVDTIGIARTLWSEPSARRVVAAVADQQVAVAATTTVARPLAPQPPASAPAVSCPDPSTGRTTPTTTGAGEYGGAVAEAIDCARSLPLPIGWRVPDDCRKPGADGECGFSDRVSDAWAGVRAAGVGGSTLKLVGWALTIGALTFGAPFWFDLLNRFGSLRGAGAKPRTAAET